MESSKEKKLRIVLIVLILITLIILFCFIFKNTVTIYSNSEEIEAGNIKTKLDLDLIFNRPFESNNEDSYTNDNSIAIIHNNKIYFTFSPTNCFYLADRDDWTKNICKNYNEKTEKKAMKKVYLMTSHLNGANVKKIASYNYDATKPFNFSYSNNKYALYETSEGIYKLDFNNNSTKKIKEYGTVIVHSNITNNDSIMFITVKDKDNNNLKQPYTLEKYNSKSIKKDNSFSIYSENDIITDTYDNSIYTYASSSLFENQKNEVYLYKNGEEIYKTNELSGIYSLVMTEDNVYLLGEQIIGTGFDYKYKIIKLNKTTNAKEEVKEYENTFYNYIGTVNNKIFLSNVKGIYTFKEEDKKIEKLERLISPSDSGIYKDYVYSYRGYFNELNDEDNTELDNYNLILYNTKTNNAEKYKDILYYYFDDNKLFIVQGKDELIIKCIEL